MPTDRVRRWTIRSGRDFGRTIADLRVERGLTQTQLARQSGVTRHYLAELERGVTALVLDRVVRLLRRLGAEVTVTARRESDG